MFPSSIKIENKIYKPIDASPVERFARILTDYERTSDHRPRTHGQYPQTIPSIDYIHMMSYTSDVGCPDVMNLFDDTWCRLDKGKQILWMDVNCLAIYGKLFNELNSTERQSAISMWRYISKGNRAFTNGCSWDNGRADYIQKINLTEVPIEQEQLVCSTNNVKIIGEPKYFYSNYLSLGNKKYLHYPIECLDPSRPLPIARDLFSMDWLCHKPTNSTGQYLGNGRYEITPFNYDNRYILWGKNGIGWLRADWVEFI